LVLGLPGVPAAALISRVDRPLAIGNRTSRIGKVGIMVGILIGRRRLERELAMGAAIEFALRRVLLRRPFVVAHPFVAARLKEHRLGKVDLRSSLEVLGKPGSLNHLAVILAGRTVERNPTQRVALAIRPAAMVPGARYEKVLLLYVMLLQQLVNT